MNRTEPVTPETSPAVAFLERDYDKPGVFRRPVGTVRGELVYHIDGMYLPKVDHAEPCPCAAVVNAYGARWSSDQGWHPRFRDPINDDPLPDRATEGVTG